MNSRQNVWNTSHECHISMLDPRPIASARHTRTDQQNDSCQNTPRKLLVFLPDESWCDSTRFSGMFLHMDMALDPQHHVSSNSWNSASNKCRTSPQKWLTSLLEPTFLLRTKRWKPTRFTQAFNEHYSNVDSFYRATQMFLAGIYSAASVWLSTI